MTIDFVQVSICFTLYPLHVYAMDYIVHSIYALYMVYIVHYIHVYRHTPIWSVKIRV